MGWNRSFRVLLACLILILLFAALPLIGALAAGGVAGALGCPLDEGSVHPCPFLGRDLGEALYAFGVLGWLSVLTIPAGFVLLLIWLIVAIVLIVRRLRAGSAGAMNKR
jgi:hypothetical protein